MCGTDLEYAAVSAYAMPAMHAAYDLSCLRVRYAVLVLTLHMLLSATKAISGTGAATTVLT